MSDAVLAYRSLDRRARRRCWPGLAARGGVKTAPIVAAAGRLQRPDRRPRARLRRPVPPAQRRLRAGAAGVPGRQRPARTLAGARAVRHPRDRLRPGQQLPRHLGRLARRPGPLRAPVLRLDRKAPAGAGRPGARPRRVAGARAGPAVDRRLAAAHLQPARARFRGRPRAAAAGATATCRPGRANWWPASTRSTSTASRRHATPRCGTAACSRCSRGWPHPAPPPPPGAPRVWCATACTAPASTVQAAPGSGGKRDITLARFAPRFVAAGAARPRGCRPRRRPRAGDRRRPGRRCDRARHWRARASPAP